MTSKKARGGRIDPSKQIWVTEGTSQHQAFLLKEDGGEMLVKWGSTLTTEWIDGSRKVSMDLGSLRGRQGGRSSSRSSGNTTEMKASATTTTAARRGSFSSRTTTVDAKQHEAEPQKTTMTQRESRKRRRERIAEKAAEDDSSSSVMSASNKSEQRAKTDEQDDHQSTTAKDKRADQALAAARTGTSNETSAAANGGLSGDKHQAEDNGKENSKKRSTRVDQESESKAGDNKGKEKDSSKTTAAEPTDEESDRVDQNSSANPSVTYAKGTSVASVEKPAVAVNKSTTENVRKENQSAPSVEEAAVAANELSVENVGNANQPAGHCTESEHFPMNTGATLSVQNNDTEQKTANIKLPPAMAAKSASNATTALRTPATTGAKTQPCFHQESTATKPNPVNGEKEPALKTQHHARPSARGRGSFSNKSVGSPSFSSLAWNAPGVLGTNRQFQLPQQKNYMPFTQPQIQTPRDLPVATGGQFDDGIDGSTTIRTQLVALPPHNSIQSSLQKNLGTALYFQYSTPDPSVFTNSSGGFGMLSRPVPFGRTRQSENSSSAASIARNRNTDQGRQIPMTHLASRRARR